MAIAGLTAYWNAAKVAHSLFEHRATHHIENDRGARLLLKQCLRQNDHSTICAHDRAVIIDNTDTITIAIKGNADICFVSDNRTRKVGQIFWVTRIRVMVREAPIWFDIQWDHLKAAGAQGLYSERASDTVTTIEYHFARCELTDLFSKAGAIGRTNINTLEGSSSCILVGFVKNDLFDRLQIAIWNRRASVLRISLTELHAIIAWWVVAGRNGSTTIDSKMCDREIHHGCRNLAEQDHIDTTCSQARYKGLF